MFAFVFATCFQVSFSTSYDSCSIHHMYWFSIGKPKLLARLITKGANSTANQSETVAIAGNLIKARENTRIQIAIGLGFSLVEKVA